MNSIIRLRDAHPKVREAFKLYRAWQRLVGDYLRPAPHVGELGEIIVEHHFPGMRRAPHCNAGYDFIDHAGKRVQVKAWGSEKRSHDNVRDLSRVDRFIRVRIYDDGYEIMVDMLTAEHGASGGIVVNASGSIRPYGIEFADPKLSEAAKRAWVTMRAKPDAMMGAAA